MIPTRQQVVEKIDEFNKKSSSNMFTHSFINNWLEEIECPTEVTVAGQVVNPREQILDDLISYPNFHA